MLLSNVTHTHLIISGTPLYIRFDRKYKNFKYTEKWHFQGRKTYTHGRFGHENNTISSRRLSATSFLQRSNLHMQAIVLNTSFNVDPLTQFQDARQIFETALSQAESDK